MAGRGTRASSRPSRARARPAYSRRRLRLAWIVAVVAVTVYLYYRPLSSYFDTRRELAAERADVVALRAAKLRLDNRLAVSTSVDAERREARRIGFVRPGEHLFIVKGIPEWRRARRSLEGNG